MKRIRINIYKNLILAVLFMAALISSPGAARASLYLDYQLAGNQSSGSAYYNPAADSALHGTNISVVSLYGNETPLNSGVSQGIQSGLLSFTTGGLSGTSTIGNTTVWNFGTPGSLTLTGGISALGIASGSNLLTGAFTSATATQINYGYFKFDLVFTSFGGTSNQTINNYFGVLPGTNPDTMTMTFYANAINGGGFRSTNIVSGNITDNPTPAPIPAVAWLLGTGLMGLAGLRRREVQR
jgi:hypothetical protein